MAWSLRFSSRATWRIAETLYSAIVGHGIRRTDRRNGQGLSMGSGARSRDQVRGSNAVSGIRRITTKLTIAAAMR